MISKITVLATQLTVPIAPLLTTRAPLGKGCLTRSYLGHAGVCPSPVYARQLNKRKSLHSLGTVWTLRDVVFTVISSKPNVDVFVVF